MNVGIEARRFSAWAPGLRSRDDWRGWARGGRGIPRADESPALEWAPPLFRRRLSLLSKMTLEAARRVTRPGEEAPVVFVSLRGELDRQFTINRALAEEGSLAPAAFSLSVFNAPPALASIALANHAPYAALYPDSFRDGFLCAAARLAGDDPGEIILIYAEENIRAEYLPLRPEPAGDAPPPFAFAVRLGLSGGGGSAAVPLGSAAAHGALDGGLELLRFLCIQETDIYAA